MSRVQKYQRKIKKYLSKLSKIKFRDKLDNLILRIGISSPPIEFDLVDTHMRELIFPCNLGVLFCGKFKNTLFEKARNELDKIFDSFFYHVSNLGEFKFPIDVLSRGIKKEFKEVDKTKKKLEMHPTNKFYQILINNRIKNKLDMILAITDLPIYSSSNNDIIFLFGEANLKHRSCVVSSLKLKEKFYNRAKNKNLFEWRVIKEIIHEIGHLILGLEHCANNSCVMRFSREIEEIDVKSFKLCEECNLKLKKVRKSFNI